jgi:hypothetical protein
MVPILIAAGAVAAAAGSLAAKPEAGPWRAEPVPALRTAGDSAPLHPKLGTMSDPVYAVAGLRILRSGRWLPVPDQLPKDVPVELAVEVRNHGTAGTAVLTAAAEVWPLDESPAVHVMSGAATVVMAPGAAYFLELEPPWRPLSHGSYRIFGTAAEDGLVISGFSESVQVLGGAAVCPVPGVNLP